LPHSSNTSITSTCPRSNLGIPKSRLTLNPETRTGRRSTYFLDVRSFKNSPSQSGMLKRKRLNFCGSGSTLKKQARSELGSIWLLRSRKRKHFS